MQIINYYYLNIKAQFYKGKNLGGQKKVERGNQQNWGGGDIALLSPSPLPVEPPLCYMQNYYIARVCVLLRLCI